MLRPFDDGRLSRAVFQVYRRYLFLAAPGSKSNIINPGYLRRLVRHRRLLVPSDLREAVVRGRLSTLKNGRSLNEESHPLFSAPHWQVSTLIQCSSILVVYINLDPVRLSNARHRRLPDGAPILRPPFGSFVCKLSRRNCTLRPTTMR